MPKKTIFIVCIFFIILGSAFYNFRLTKLSIKEHTYRVEIPKSDITKMLGLMFRLRLAENKGMLFEFPYEARHSMWMKNTFIPLDMLWLDTNFKVVHIEENVQTCRASPCKTYFPPKEKTKFVLELNAGQVAKNNIVIGDKAYIETK